MPTIGEAQSCLGGGRGPEQMLTAGCYYIIVRPETGEPYPCPTTVSDPLSYWTTDVEEPLSLDSDVTEC